MKGVEFRAAVDDVYQKHTGKSTPHGAQVWFSELIGVTNQSVWAWTRRPRVKDGPHLLALAMLMVLPKGSKTLKAVATMLESWRKK